MMRINVTWNDRRVDFLNLRDDIYQNLVPEDEASKMWIPEIGKNKAGDDARKREKLRLQHSPPKYQTKNLRSVAFVLSMLSIFL